MFPAKQDQTNVSAVILVLLGCAWGSAERQIWRTQEWVPKKNTLSLQSLSRVRHSQEVGTHVCIWVWWTRILLCGDFSCHIGPLQTEIERLLGAGTLTL